MEVILPAYAVLQKDENGGKSCEDTLEEDEARKHLKIQNLPAIISETNCGREKCTAAWSEWGECENGRRVRTWEIKHSPKRGGAECEFDHKNGHEDRESCGTNCDGYWTEWTKCEDEALRREDVLDDEGDGIHYFHSI